ncbi:MAG: FAD-dependent monooxygenase [Rhodospirillales bacterium]|nr:FAD-dependent monooxygenase [Rhodospirillales bacterium]
MSAVPPKPVLISGGGPVGLIAAYALAKEGIPSIVFDENSELQEDPRAATTHPATLELLAKLGIVDQVIEQGLTAAIFRFWDRPTGELIAEFDHALLKDDTEFPFVVQCEQFKLTHILLDLIDGMDNCDVRFSHRVIGVDAGEDEVTITVQTPGVNEQISGSYLIGCDGGRSVFAKKWISPLKASPGPNGFWS